MNHPIVISSYVLGSCEEESAKKLIVSCSQWGIEADIVGTSRLQSKAAFILEKLRAWKRPVFWVGADALFLQRPSFELFSECLFSVRVNEFLPKHHALRILPHVIYAGYHPHVLSFLEKWSHECITEELLERHSLFPFLPMPLKFSKLFSSDNLFISEKEVVIEHSRSIQSLPEDCCCH